MAVPASADLLWWCGSVRSGAAIWLGHRRALRVWAKSTCWAVARHNWLGDGGTEVRPDSVPIQARMCRALEHNGLLGLLHRFLSRESM